MRVYVSSHDKALANECADELRSAGLNIVSTWHYREFKRTAEYTEGDRAHVASGNANEISTCGALVIVAGPDKYPGGKFVEAGIAIGLGRPIAVVGRRENMMLWHPIARAFDTAKEAAAWLAAM